MNNQHSSVTEYQGISKSITVYQTIQQKCLEEWINHTKSQNKLNYLTKQRFILTNQLIYTEKTEQEVLPTNRVCDHCKTGDVEMFSSSYNAASMMRSESDIDLSITGFLYSIKNSLMFHVLGFFLRYKQNPNTLNNI